MAYIAQTDIESLALGKSWRKGQSIGDEAIPQPLRGILENDGHIVKVKADSPPPAEEPAPAGPESAPTRKARKERPDGQD